MPDTAAAIRFFRWDDLPRLVEITNHSADIDHADERYTPETLREELEGFSQPERDCLVAVDAAGCPLGYAYVEWRDDPGRVWGYGWGSVHPDHRRRGIGVRLVQAADAHFARRAAALEVGERAVFIQRFIGSTNAGELAIVHQQGYAALRSSYRMQIALDRPFPPAALPDGFALRPFEVERHGRAVYQADTAAFLDSPSRSEPVPYEEWHARQIETKVFDPALWLVAWVGDEVAGFCYSAPWGEDQPDLGWIAQLGVLPGWRRHGLGSALLRQSIHLLQQRGFERVALAVRADNPRALAIYERAGMSIYSHFIHYRRVLRGDASRIVS
jgi:mycothiol synthase